MFITAPELNVNFDGDLNRAKELIKIAAENGADAAKFQHYTADTLVSDFGFNSLNNSVRTHQSEWKDSVSATYDKASLNKEWTEELSDLSHSLGIGFFTSPYSLDLVDYVEPYVDAYKVGSGDITWIEIIEHIAKKNKPLIIASGASSLADVKRAVEKVLSINSQLALLQCNTNYTGSIENFKYINLNVLKTFKKYFPNIILGLSDHTPGHSTVLGAVSLGAKIIEKHFTDNNNLIGPDHSFSMDPKSWKILHYFRTPVPYWKFPTFFETFPNKLILLVEVKKNFCCCLLIACSVKTDRCELGCSSSQL